MSLGLVDSPKFGDSLYCPVTLQGADPVGFYNTGHVLKGVDPHVWISHRGATILAECAGYVSPETHGEALERAAALECALDEAAAMISELRRAQESITGLVAEGYSIVKAGGRPSNATKPENIKAELVG